MQEWGLIKVLLVEDDEDDYILTRDLLSEIHGHKFALDWIKTYPAGLEAMVRNQHDICLVDYRLGAHNGVELLRAAIELGCQAPVILLTGAGEHEIDLEAMQAGAADYLVKSELQASAFDRSIRYALQRKRAAALAAFEQARLAAFGAEVGLALTRRDSLDGILDRCARAMSQYLSAAVAQISTFDSQKKSLEPRATASQTGHRTNATPPLPPVRLDIGDLLEGRPVLIKQLARDERFVDHEWVKREGMVSYAACPLLLGDRLVGLMSVFAQHPLTDQILQEMASVANGIALCIEGKRSEEALGASEVKYRAVVESIHEVIFQLDEFGNWAFLNPAWQAVTGFEIKPTLGTFFLDYIQQEDQEQSRHVFLKLLERKLDYFRYETRFRTHQGQERWVEVYAQPIVSNSGQVVGISGTLTDISERKEAKIKIERLAAFPKVNPNPVLEFSQDGKLSYANEAAEKLAQSLGQSNLLDILPPDPGALVRECLATGQDKLGEQVVMDGRTITWSFFPVAGSHLVHCYGADITEKLDLEARFHHAQKLESVGQLAAGVAHDFNNILTVIQGYSDCLLGRNFGDAPAARALKQISDASKRAAALTRQLLLFSRKQLIQPKVLDLNAVLQNLANMLPRLLGEDIGLEMSYRPALPRIEADTGMLEQIVMNLAVNARDAMPKGGKLSIATDAVTLGEDYIRHNPESRPGAFVCVTVTDTGCGMDRKTLARIFEPFFTTKEVGKGTGLGLATVHGIVKQHQGWLEVTSKPGIGTSFKIYLPAVAVSSDSAAESASTPDEVRGGTETILVVEDEPVVREFVREVLQQYHYRVIEACSGVEALRVWDEFQGEIDLLLTDMVMPEGLTGRELAEQIRARKPDLRVIFTSGYSEQALERDFGSGDSSFLSKPYQPAQLVRIVRQSLDRPPNIPSDLVAA
jgi:PAS domain S-box-containing protein